MQSGFSVLRSGSSLLGRANEYRKPSQAWHTLGAFCMILLSLIRIYNPASRSGTSSLGRANEYRKPNQAWQTLVAFCVIPLSLLRIYNPAYSELDKLAWQSERNQKTESSVAHACGFLCDSIELTVDMLKSLILLLESLMLFLNNFLHYSINSNLDSQ